MSVTTNVTHSLAHYMAVWNPSLVWDEAVHRACEVGEQIATEQGSFWVYCCMLSNYGPMSYRQWKALELFYQELRERDHEYPCKDASSDFETHQLKKGNRQVRDLLARCCQDVRLGWSEARDLAQRLFDLPKEEIRP